MPGLGFRYVGSDRLPMRLSEFDVELYFALTDSDLAVLNKRFRTDRRAGAAIQLVFLRASGHSLGQVSTLPRQLLHHVGQRLGLLSRQLMRSRAREERLTLRSPRDRILHCLQLEHDAYGRFTPPGTLMQWAGTLGIAHETLYRALAQMEQEGVIVRDGIQIVLSEIRRKNAGRSRRPQCR